MTTPKDDPRPGPAAPVELGFDPDALRAKYREERDKRLRPDGNDQYVEPTGAFAHFVDDPYVEPGYTREPLGDEVDVALIGGGFGGLLAGARLRQLGVEDVRIIEKGGDFGGTWYWNRYPGVACDIESYVYLPLLEELDYVPREKYSRGEEIFAHCKAIAEKYDLYRNACLQTEVTGIRWDEDTSRWIISTNHGDAMKARFVCLANGFLQKPKLPGIPASRRSRAVRSTRAAGITPTRAGTRRAISPVSGESASASSAPAPRRCNACRISAPAPATSTSSSGRRRRSTYEPTARRIRSGPAASSRAGTRRGWTTSTSSPPGGIRKRIW